MDFPLVYLSNENCSITKTTATTTFYWHMYVWKYKATFDNMYENIILGYFGFVIALGHVFGMLH